ncbi:DUF802 domain-containing protein [Luteimonas sp. SDU82]|uniref:DUF802 domain-containing protein n=1 Tax=Luteimonas sp. SDU82 TaxID=3422592 RepID=UPI003EBDE9BA
MTARPYPLLFPCIFLAGLAIIGWIGAGYLGSSLLGVVVVALIVACYLAGALELHRYRQATTSLARALDATDSAGSGLGAWLERLQPALRTPVRLRIEAGQAALPAPALAPSLAALLVLLGMLGTLLGMMATLRGTGLALDSAVDLDAIRGSLSNPVRGLALAFGTSIAGVGASAALSLLSTLARRERLQLLPPLDAAIAGPLRAYSQAHQREQAFGLLQRQAELMPALVDRLQEMSHALEARASAADAQLQARQDAFHANVEHAYAQLAGSVGQSLAQSVAESSRAVTGALQPVIETTLAGMARDTSALRETVDQAVERQLDALTIGFETASERAAHSWTLALAEQQRANAGLAGELREVFAQAAQAQERQASGLIDGIAARLEATGSQVGTALEQALARQDAANNALAVRNEAALATASAAFGQQATGLLDQLQQSHQALQAALASGDEARLAAWAGAFDATSGELARRWEQAGEHVASRQQEICATLERTAGEIAAQAQAHAGATIAEVSRLMQTAAEAPRAAAEVVGELRQSLSDSMVRDTAMLDERARLLATLQTLLDAVNHASGEQRAAVDALVTTSADLLERTGARLVERIELEAGRLDAAAGQLTAGAADVAGLGDAFGAAVESFGQANEALLERLQQVAGALDGSLARSDEQLAYYVAQAREVVELSVLSQQQIIAELQRVADLRQAAEA